MFSEDAGDAAVETGACGGVKAIGRPIDGAERVWEFVFHRGFGCGQVLPDAIEMEEVQEVVFVRVLKRREFVNWSSIDFDTQAFEGALGLDHLDRVAAREGCEISTNEPEYTHRWNP